MEIVYVHFFMLLPVVCSFEDSVGFSFFEDPTPTPYSSTLYSLLLCTDAHSWPARGGRFLTRSAFSNLMELPGVLCFVCLFLCVLAKSSSTTGFIFFNERQQFSLSLSRDTLSACSAFVSPASSVLRHPPSVLRSPKRRKAREVE